MTDPYRVLITGSRGWDDEEQISAALTQILLDHAEQGVVVVNGMCPQGADWLCFKWVQALRRSGVTSVSTEEHPADWKTLGLKAGIVRNDDMLATSPDEVLAFIKNRSRGASYTARRAEELSIPVTRYEV